MHVQYCRPLAPRKSTALFGWLLAFALTSCSLNHSAEKLEPTLPLPPASTVGANTLGFEVDGRVWTTYGQSCFGLFGGNCKDNVLYVSFHRFPGGRRTLSTSTSLDTNQYHEFFEVEFDSLAAPGVYPAGRVRTVPISALGKNLYGPSLSNSDNHYFLGGARNAVPFVLTRVDTVHQIVSGTFEGRLEDLSAPGHYLTLRHGRFDVTYGP